MGHADGEHHGRGERRGQRAKSHLRTSQFYIVAVKTYGTGQRKAMVEIDRSTQDRQNLPRRNTSFAIAAIYAAISGG
jgi:hypothetical protein